MNRKIKQSSKFKTGVIKVVKLIPQGKVVSYGQVSLYLGLPRAGRQVGWILNKLETPTPWWRVVNNEGRISIKGSKFSAEDQAKLLRLEGIIIRKDLTFDIEKYRFLPDKKFLEELELDSEYIDFISNKLPYSKYFDRKNNI